MRVRRLVCGWQCRVRRPPAATRAGHRRPCYGAAAPMPLDSVTFGTYRPRPSQMPCLDDAERQAAACFGPRLQATLAATPPISLPLVVLVDLSEGLAGANFRLAPQGQDSAVPGFREMVVARVPAGLPTAPGERRALSLRIASAAAGAWRQRCQIERLGLSTS